MKTAGRQHHCRFEKKMKIGANCLFSSHVLSEKLRVECHASSGCHYFQGSSHARATVCPGLGKWTKPHKKDPNIGQIHGITREVWVIPVAV